MEISTLEALRGLYAHPSERVRRKQIDHLDAHARRFIGLSPFLVLSTCDATHDPDASPRGGEPGFVKVDAEGRLLVPDSPGNNRLDSLENIVHTGKVGRLSYLHCPKAFLRSKLWSESAKVERSTMPTIGQMIADQTGLDIPYESREDMERRYAADL